MNLIDENLELFVIMTAHVINEVNTQFRYALKRIVLLEECLEFIIHFSSIVQFPNCNQRFGSIVRSIINK